MQQIEAKMSRSKDRVPVKINLPTAYCEICSEKKVRASCECLNCNIPLCHPCSETHLKNSRLSSHKIIEYKTMLMNGVNAVKEAQNTMKSGYTSDDLSLVSPYSRKTSSKLLKKETSPDSFNQPMLPVRQKSIRRVSANQMNTELQSRLTLRSPTKRRLEEPEQPQPTISPLLIQQVPQLKFMHCLHHPGMEMCFYSAAYRSFHCDTCLTEIQGTPREGELNLMRVSDVAKMYQT